MSTVKLQQVMLDSQVAFGTSGARGLVVQMTDSVCAAYTHAFLQVMQPSFKFERVVLGVDLRPSSMGIASACAQAIQQAGYEVEFCGALPTPALALYAQEQQVPAIMVTGSHIPFDRNGLKFYRPDGEISKTDEQAMLQADVAAFNPAAYSLPAVNAGAVQNYIQRYLDFFPKSMLQGFKLGLYEHSSVARDVIKTILTKLGAEVVSLGRTDQFTPIDTEAVSAQDVAQGLAWSAQYGFDAIISTDGDGDRPLMSDERGNWLRGDIVGLLCARYLDIKTLAVPVSCNTALEQSGAFTQIVRTRIGSPYVIAAMQALQAEAKVVAGFEANGGFLLGTAVTGANASLQALPTRDAVLPVLAVLAAASLARQPISKLLSDLPQRYTFSDRLQNFPTAASQQLLAKLAGDNTQFTQMFGASYGSPVRQDQTDGLRLTLANGDIIHLRPSGNAPELRCYCEASTLKVAEHNTQAILRQIQSCFA